MSPEYDTDGWLEYRREILYRLKELSDGQKAADGRLDELQSSVAELKTQRGIAGWTGAMLVTTAVSAAVSYLTGRSVQ